MTFEEWLECFPVYWNELGKEDLEAAFEAGWREGHKEGYIYRETVYKAQEGGV